jgi:hypothetical protein
VKYYKITTKITGHKDSTFLVEVISRDLNSVHIKVNNKSHLSVTPDFLENSPGWIVRELKYRNTKLGKIFYK